MSSEALKIYVHQQLDGVTYELDPVSKMVAEKHAIDTRPASRLFISYGDKAQVEWMHGPVPKQVAMLVTGLSQEKLEELDGVIFLDPKTNKPIFTETQQDV